MCQIPLCLPERGDLRTLPRHGRGFAAFVSRSLMGKVHGPRMYTSGSHMFSVSDRWLAVIDTVID